MRADRQTDRQTDRHADGNTSHEIVAMSMSATNASLAVDNLSRTEWSVDDPLSNSVRPHTLRVRISAECMHAVSATQPDVSSTTLYILTKIIPFIPLFRPVAC